MILRIIQIALCTALLSTAAQDKKMTNADIIALGTAGLSDDIIIAKIQTAPVTDFDTSVEGLKALKAAHISNPVIHSMMVNGKIAATSPAAPAQPSNTPAEPSNKPDDLHPPGIYMYAAAASAHNLIELQRASVKETKGKGAALSGFTYGIKKFHVLGVFDGPNATVKTADPNPVFYVYSPEDNHSFGGSYITPDVFTLVKLEQKNNTREIEEGSGSIWGTKMGEDDKAKHGFTSEKVKPGIYKLTLLQPLPPGEYAFSQNRGMFYDFRILQPE